MLILLTKNNFCSVKKIAYNRVLGLNTMITNSVLKIVTVSLLVVQVENSCFNTGRIPDTEVTCERLSDVLEFGRSSWKKLTIYNRKDINRYEMLSSDTFSRTPNLEKLQIVKKVSVIQPNTFIGLKQLKDLCLRRNEVEKIPAEAFSQLHLQILNISNNQIEELSPGIVRNTQVPETDISHNKLVYINTGTLDVPSLEKVILSHNQLEYVLLGAFNDNIINLDLSYNKLSIVSRDLLSRRCIKIINLAHNNLIHLRNLKMGDNLEEVNVSFNNISYFFHPQKDLNSPRPLAYCKTLKHLHMQHNRLYFVPADAFSEFPQLTTLNLSSNVVEVVYGNFSKNTHLREIDLSNNRLMRIDHVFQTRSLDKIILSRNYINYIAPGTFNPTLCLLDLSYNDISEFEPNVIQNLQLRQLYLSHNNLKNLGAFGDLEYLEEIDVSHNEISYLMGWGIGKPSNEPFLSSKQLRYLYINNNKLTVLHTYMFSHLLRLWKLDFSNNMIQSVTEGLSSNLNLHEINLSSNKLTVIPKGIFDTASLKNMYLSNNSIKLVSGNAFNAGLEILDLSYNQVEHIEGDIVKDKPPKKKQLRRLHLSHNKLLELNVSFVKGMENLELLDVSHNDIHYCNFSGFDNLKKLMYLYLNNNKLILMDLSTQTWNNLSHIEEISIRGNPWSCPCLDLLIKHLDDKQIRSTLCDKEFMKLGYIPVCIVPRMKTCKADALIEKDVYDNFATTVANYKCDKLFSM